jgi:polar amino acid transport system substrate-binding protein
MKKLAFSLAFTTLFGVFSLLSSAIAADSSKISPVIDRIMAKKEVVVGTAASMPPLNMTTKDGRIIGMEVDLASMIAGGMEVKLTWKQMPFDELIPALLSGKVDMVLSNMTMTPSRNLKIAFAGPYFQSGKSILVKEENVASLDSIEKLNNPANVLVALKGSTSQVFVENILPKAKLELAPDYGQAVDMVKNGKAKAMVADWPICQVSVLRYPEAKLTSLDKPISYEPIGVALPLGDPLLVNLVENTLRSLDRMGRIEALLDKWFKNGAWLSELP